MYSLSRFSLKMANISFKNWLMIHLTKTQVGDINSFGSSEQTISCPEKTVAALFRHLQNVRYKNGWALDVLTLSALLELQGLSILDTHSWYKPFLKAFLDQDHRDQILLQEKGRLKQFLEGALLGKH